MIARKLFPSVLTILPFLFCLNLTVFAQDGEEATASSEPSEAVKQGETLYNANCTSCHKVKQKLIGPALLGAEGRWEENGEYEGKSGQEWLYEWIRNSQAVIDEGHSYANQLFDEWNKSVMTAMPQLSDEDISNILAYVEYAGTKEPETATTAAGGEGAPAGGGTGLGKYTELFLYILVGMLVIIALILMRVTTSLNKLVHEKEGTPLPQPVPIYRNKKLFTTLVLALIIYVGYTTVNSAIDLGRQQGYQPPQPIKFSHKLHAGVNKIDCQYCHYGADESKHSNIPSQNICMNCHKGVQSGNVNGQYGRKEITKIYASIGYNPNAFGYIENYQELPKDSAKQIYTEWLKGDPDNTYTESDLEEVLAYVQEPIDWVRIHNLPDHVYFNHSQHVNVAGLECQTCHGPVEEMEELYQFAPLSMGWCISCHRDQQVNFANNDYYKIYSKFHEDLKAGNISKITVEDIGGTECQKCHY